MAQHENPPAFPRDERYLGHNGMTLRDWFAGQALAGLLGNDIDGEDGKTIGGHQEHYASVSYGYADAMLAERGKAPEASAATTMQHVGYVDEGQFHWMSGIAPRNAELYAERPQVSL